MQLKPGANFTVPAGTGKAIGWLTIDAAVVECFHYTSHHSRKQISAAYVQELHSTHAGMRVTGCEANVGASD